MKKDQVLKTMSEKSGLTKKDCEAAYVALFETLAECMESGDKHAVPEFGTFESAERKERTTLKKPGQPELGTKVVPAHNAPKFKPAKALKERVK